MAPRWRYPDPGQARRRQAAGGLGQRSSLRFTLALVPISSDMTPWQRPRCAGEALLSTTPPCSTEPGEPPTALGLRPLSACCTWEIIQERLEREYDLDLITHGRRPWSTIEQTDGTTIHYRQLPSGPDARYQQHQGDARAHRRKVTSCCCRSTWATSPLRIEKRGADQHGLPRQTRWR